jgi:hypothetical protein
MNSVNFEGSMKSSYLFSIGALVLGLVGGYVAGKGGSSDSGERVDGEQVSSRTRSASREGTARESAGRRVARTTDTGEIVNLPGSTVRVQSLMDFYGSLSPERLEEEAGKLDELPANERILASFLLFGRWGETDPMAAMNFASTMGFTGMFVRPTVLQSWASVDPVNAARYYQNNPREFAMMGAMGGGARGGMSGMAGAAVIAGEWAKQDPTAALAWAGSLPREKSQAIQAVISQMANTDPKGAADMLGKLSGEDLSDSYRAVASRYGAKDFAEASAWVRTLPAQEQAAAMASAVNGLSKQDPVAAAFELGKMEEGAEKDRAVSGVVENLARVDPVAASELLKKQTSEGALRESMRELMPTWVMKDPSAALEFANSYQAGPIRDSAIQSYVWSHNEGSPSDLVAVAESISDEGDRYRTVGMAAMRWMREDEEAAKAYIQQSESLPEDAKTRILEGRGFWGGRGGRR